MRKKSIGNKIAEYLVITIAVGLIIVLLLQQCSIVMIKGNDNQIDKKLETDRKLDLDSGLDLDFDSDKENDTLTNKKENNEK